MAAHSVILRRTPEVVDHVEVSDLGEEASHGFTVVLAVSDGPGPAHKTRTTSAPTQAKTHKELRRASRQQR